MAIGDILLDKTYTPDDALKNNTALSSAYFKKTIKCPVTFTHDPIEYATSYLGYRLKPLQKTILEDLFQTFNDDGTPKYLEMVNICGMRSGKSLQIFTPILMYDGTLKYVQDVIVGDKVMGPDSTPRTVLATSLGESEMFEIKQSCAMTYVVNDVHILSLKKAKSTNCEKIYQSSSDIVNIPIKEYLSKSKKWKYFFRGYKAGCFNFPAQPVTVDPYLLGSWLADGDSIRLTLTSMDSEVSNWWIQFAKNNELLCRIEDTNGDKAKRFHLRSISGKYNHVWDEFKKLNLESNKHIPQCYISNSKEIRLKLLAGILDGDGYYSSKKHGYEITLANEVLANDVKRLADSLGYRTNIREKRTTCQIKGFVGKAWRLTIFGEVWEIPMLVERKKYVHNGKASNKEIGLSSLKVRSIGWGKYAGILVDKDNLFCLADGTVTHNSVIGGVIGSFLLHKLLELDDPGLELGQLPGQKLVGEYIANSEQQSKQTAYATFEGIVSNTEWWKKYVRYLLDREENEGKETLFIKHQKKISFLEKNLDVLSLHSNSASLAGLTAFFVCFDELSRFDVSEGSIQQNSEKRSAQAVYYTASRAAKSISPYSRIITITSPMYETDFGMQLLCMAGDIKAGSSKQVVDALRSRYTDAKVDGMIGYHYSTFEANPKTVDDPYGYVEADFIKEKQKSPAAYTRDYLAIPPSAISPFFELPERLDGCVVKRDNPIVVFEDKIIEEALDHETGTLIRRYICKTMYPLHSDKLNKYFICCDQGEVKDSFTVAMGHGEEVPIEVPGPGGKMMKTSRFKAVIDFVEEWKPNKEQRVTVSFQNVEEIIQTLNSLFYISRVVYDQWSSVESIQRLFSEGVYAEKMGATIDMYDTMKILIYSGMVELPDTAKLITELRQLNNIKNRAVDHGSDGCFTGDTCLKLLDGTTPTLKELAEKGSDHKFWVYSALSDGTVVPAEAYNAHKTKKVNLLCEVTLDNNEVVKCTPNHLFMLRTGEYIPAKELKVNDSLMPLYWKYEKVGYTKGGAQTYEKIWNRDHWSFTHMRVMKHLEYTRTKNDVIHHKNINPHDNSPDNLEILLRSDHAKLHQKITHAWHTPEAMEKRVESFKKTYHSSKELQLKFKENGKKVLNNQKNKQKLQEGRKKYEASQKLKGFPGNLKPLKKPLSDKELERCRKNIAKMDKAILQNNAKKLNTEYWKSDAGIKRRAELSKTQLVVARNKRTKESFQRGGLKCTETYKKRRLLIIDNNINYCLSYHHIKKLYGGSIESWKKWLPDIDFSKNANNLLGLSIEQAIEKTKLTKCGLFTLLKKLNKEDVILKNHKITKIKYVQSEEDVYDITVPIYNNFALKAGIFVHNSKDLADAVVRCVWCIYNECIKDTVHGDFLKPTGQYFATTRSIAEMSRRTMAQALDGSSGIFENNFSGNTSANSLFGKGMMVKSNVISNL
jgi:intein/homing endonuclease